MSLTVTKPDGTALGTLAFAAARGTPSAHSTILVKNTGGTPEAGHFIVMYAESTPGSGDYVSGGTPVVDEVIGRAQITAIDSSGTPGQQTISAVQPMGNGVVAILPTILPGNSLTIDIWIAQGSSSASGGTVNIELEVAGATLSFAVPGPFGLIAQGVDSGKNQAKSFLISGRKVTATGTPDNNVQIAAGVWLLSGVEYTDGAETIPLSQNDSAAAALTTGKSYYATVTQGATLLPTITKGLQGTAPLVPTPPAGELFLALVKVNYNATATVINPGDVTLSTLTYGRYLAIAPGSGLTLDVHPGEALVAGFHTIGSTVVTLALVASSTNRIWLEFSGNLTVTQTAALPSAGALLLWTAVTDGTHVTALTDLRLFLNTTIGGVGLHASTHAVGGADVLTPAAIGAAEIDSPDFTGIPEAATAAPGTATIQLATTAFVAAAVATVVNLLWQPVVDFAGDGVSQPAALSPYPTTQENLFVFVGTAAGGLTLQRQGAGKNYTYDLVGNIAHTPILVAPAVAQYRYQA